ncbi:ESPR-type extended signal peptide-containing protein [Pseudomonas nicosulfuronedens]
MNRSYRSVWCEKTGTYVAASELAKSRTKSPTSRIAAVAAAMGLGALGGAEPVLAGALDGGTVNGIATAVAVGPSSSAANPYDVVMGQGAKSTQIGTNVAGNIAIGGLATAYGGNGQTGESNIALGYQSVAGVSGGGGVGGAIALGHNAQATNWNTLALGSNAAASGIYSTAMGMWSKATADNAMALGTSSSASVQYGTALGNSSVADRAAGSGGSTMGAVSVGSGGAGTASGTRQIISVAKGTQDTDAVDVAQLTPLVAAMGGGAALDRSTGVVSAPSYLLANANSIAGTSGAATDVGTGFGKVDSALGKLNTTINTINNGAGIKYFHTNSILGDSSATGTDSTAIGPLASAGGTGSVAMGKGATANSGASIQSASLALGAGAKATAISDSGTGSGSIAIGANAQAVQTTSGGASGSGGNIAIGINANASGDGAWGHNTAIGLNAATTGYDGVALGSGASAAYQSTAVGRMAAATGNNSVATGWSAIASGQNAVALGKDAKASSVNSVALGSNSTTTADLTKAGYNPGNTALSGTASTAKGEVSVGNAGNERRLTNLAAGSAATDAVNVSQLQSEDAKVNAQGANTASALGGGATYNTTSGAITAPSYLLANANSIAGTSGAAADVGTGFAKVDSALGNLNTSISSISNTINSGSLGLVQQSAAGENLTVGKDTDGAAVDFAGTDGARKLINVADGTLAADSKDAVNGSQLFATNEQVAQNTTDIAGNTTSITNLDGRVTQNTTDITNMGDTLADAVMYDSSAHDKVTFGAADTPVQLTNVKAGELSADSLDAVNGSQLFATNEQVAQNTTDIAGNTTSITNLDGRVTTVEGDITDITNNINSGTIGLVQQSAAGENLTVGKDTDGAAVDFAGTDGARKLINVADGTLAADSKDAVNGSQLFATNEQVAQNTTDIAGNTTSITNLDGRVTQNTTDITNMGDTLADAVMYDSSAHDKVTFGAADTPVQLTNVKAGELSADSLDAVNGSQLFATNEQVAQNTTDIAGNTTSITNLDGRVTTVEGDITDITNNINSGTIGLVQQSAAGENLTVGKDTDGAAVDFAGTDGARKLINVADGTLAADSKDAVNGSQLFATNEQVAQNTTDIAGNTTSITNLDGRVTQNTTDINSINTNITNMGDTLADAVMYDSSAHDKVTFGAADTPVQLTNVKAGELSADSLDAVNGSQLFATNEQVAQNTTDIAGNTTSITNLDGRVTQNTTDINSINTNITNMGDTLADAVMYDSSAHDKVTFGAADTPVQLTNVKAGELSADSLDAVNGSQLFATNQQVDQNTTDIAGNTTSITNLDGRVTTVEGDITDITNNINSGTIGLVQQSAAGENLTVGKDTDGAAVDFAGTDGARKLINVADGTLAADSKDAVNGSQLFATNEQVAQNTTDIAGNTTSITNLDGRVTQNTTDITNMGDTLADAVMYDSSAHDKVTFGAADTPVQLTNVKAGELSADSLDAVNGSQLFATNEQVAQNTTDIAGNTTSITNLDGRVTTVEGDITDITNNINSGTIGLVQQSAAGENLTVGKDTDGAAVDFAGTDGARKLINVADGTLAADSKDAVNGSQLFATNEQVAQNTTDIAGNTTSITNLDGRVTQNTTDINSINTNITNMGDTLADAVMYDSSAHDKVTFGAADTPVQLTNVKAGELSADSLDAVNGSQLFATNEQVAQNTTDIAGNTTSITNLDGRVTQNTTDINSINTNITNMGDTLADAVMYDSSAHDKVTFGAADTPVQLTNVKAGELSADSLDAVNGSQLFATNQQVDQNTTDIAGNTTSITNLDGRVTTVEGDITDITNNINSGTIGLVQQSAAGENLTVGKDTDGAAVDFAGTDGARKLINVADGTVASGSKDAVNGGQLFGVSQSVADAMGGGSAVNADGSISAPSYSVTNVDGSITNVSNVGDAITNLDGRTAQNTTDINSINTNITNMGDTLADAVMYDSSAHDKVTFGAADTPVQLTNVKAGELSADSLDAVNGSQLFATNQQVDQNTTDIAGNTTSITNLDGRVTQNTTDINSINTNITNMGDTLADAVMYDSSAHDKVTFGAADTPVQLTNVKAGELSADSLDAVNGSQLFATNQQVDQNTTDISSITTNINSGTIGLVQQSAAGENLTVGKDTDGAAVDFAGTDGARKLINVADGTVASGSKDAVNGGQLFGVSQSVADAMGGGSVVNTDGSISAPSYSVTNVDGSITNVNNVGDAISNIDGRVANNTTSITNLDGRVTTVEGDITDITNNINSGTIGLVQQSAAGENLTVGKDTDGAAVDFAGTDGARKLINVADGTVASGSKDAVNGGQLFGVSQSVADAMGGGSVVNTDGSISAPSYSVTNVDGSITNVSNVGDAITNLDGRTAQNTTDINTINNSITSLNGVMGDAVMYDSADHDKVTLGTAGKAVQLTNIKAGELTASSSDAVNGAQLYETNNKVAVIDGRVTNLEGSVTNIVNGGGVKYFHTSSTQADSVASGADSIAVGGKAVASGEGSVALGDGANASAKGSVAVGQGASDNGRGAESYTGRYSGMENVTLGTVSFGNAATGETRTLSNVADAKQATDAVNLRQLDGAVAESKSYTDSKVAGITDGMADSIAKVDNRVTKVENDVTNVQNGTDGMFQVKNTQNLPKPKATGNSSVAGGAGAEAVADNSTAIGNNAKAKGKNSVALGANSVAERDNSVAVGSAGNERQITHVAAGTQRTDAVNLGQVSDALTAMGNESNQRYNDLKNDISEQDDRLSAGIAGAIAIASLPQPMVNGGSTTAVGMGTFNGQSAVSVGMSHVSNDGKWTTKLGGSTDTQGRFSAGGSVGYNW